MQKKLRLKNLKHKKLLLMLKLKRFQKERLKNLKNNLPKL